MLGLSREPVAAPALDLLFAAAAAMRPLEAAPVGLGLGALLDDPALLAPERAVKPEGLLFGGHSEPPKFYPLPN